MKVLRIQNKAGLFATKGEHADWNKTGFIWTKQTMRSVNLGRAFRDDPNAELVEYELVEVKRTPVAEFIKGV